MSVNRSLLPTRRRSRFARSIVAVAALVFALSAPQTALSAAYAHDDDEVPPVASPTSMTVTVQTDPSIAAALAGVPSAALPSVLAAVGTPFTVTVALWNGGDAASFPADTVVALGATGPGSLSSTQLTIPANQTSASTSVSYSAAASAVTVSASIPAAELWATSTPPFPVDLKLSILDGNSAAFKNGTAGADGAACATVDPAHPMCGIITLPNGANGQVALSLGVCPAGENCTAGGLVTQFIANLGTPGSGLYSRTNPARMTIICDKSMCGKGGVPSYRASWSDSATGGLVTTQQCPMKGVIGPTQRFCTDSVSSNRGRGGDLQLVVLFLDDVRGSIGG